MKQTTSATAICCCCCCCWEHCRCAHTPTKHPLSLAVVAAALITTATDQPGGCVTYLPIYHTSMITPLPLEPLQDNGLELGGGDVEEIHSQAQLLADRGVRHQPRDRETGRERHRAPRLMSSPGVTLTHPQTLPSRPTGPHPVESWHVKGGGGGRPMATLPHTCCRY